MVFFFFSFSLDFAHRARHQQHARAFTHAAVKHLLRPKTQGRNKENPTSGCSWLVCFFRFGFRWSEEVRKEQKSEGDKQRLCEATRVASSCLETPALPCAYCKEQVSSWTQEREERQSGEGRRRGAALTDPLSLETTTDWSHRLWDDLLTQHTHPKNWLSLSPSVTPPPPICSQANMHTRTHTYIIVQSFTPAECMGVMFVWNIFIPLWLHHSVIT